MQGNHVYCTKLIQSAIQDLIDLFPPQGSQAWFAPTLVNKTLSELILESESLGKHCDQISRVNPQSDIPILIRHAHRIAKSAKDLLSLFQHTDR